MSKSELIKKLLPGFIPLFVFIIAEEIWGVVIGLIVALAIGVLEMLWIGIKEKRFDKFVFFDTALLVILGLISIILENDIFFKLKPALIELILCAVLALSAFSKFNIIGLLTKRYTKDFSIPEEQMNQMGKTLKLMFFVFFAHSILVLYSAFFMSDRAWAFISGGLFYILFGAVFLFEFIKQKTRNKHVVIDNDEILPIVDNEGKIIGKASRTACHRGDRILHPVVHLHVLNKQNHIYLQKRPLNKLVQPGKWDTAVGGHISFGETVETALEREAYEEIGLQNFSAKLVTRYQWASDIETELVYVFVSYDFKSIKLHSDEVEEGKFWTRNQIKNSFGKDVFTPNFEYEYELIKNILQK